MDTNNLTEPESLTLQNEQTEPHTEHKPAESNSPAVKGKQNPNKPSAIERIISLSCLALLVLTLISLLFGAATAFGKSLNAYNIITFMMNIFSIRRGNIYTCLAKIAISAAYIILLIPMIKSLVGVCRRLKEISKKYEIQNRWNALYYIYLQTAKSVCRLIFLLMFAYVLSGDPLGGGAVFFLVASSALYVTVNTLIFVARNKFQLKQKNTVISLILTALRPVMLLAVLFITASYIMTPAGDHLGYGMQVIFGGYFGKGFSGIIETLYCYLIEDVFHIVNMIIFFIIIICVSQNTNFTTTGNEYANQELREKSRKILTTTGILAAIRCFLIGISAGVSNLGIDLFWRLLSSLRIYFIPVILSTLVLFLIAKGFFDPDKKQST